MALEFRPNDFHFDEMFSCDIAYIIAVTAEDASLWLDPTNWFYLSNCGAASLFHHAKEHKNKMLTIAHFNDDDTYESLYSDIVKERIIGKIKNEEQIESFEFIRFIIHSEKDKNTTIIPSLKASQDFFRIKSFFIDNKDILDNTLLMFRTSF